MRALLMAAVAAASVTAGAAHATIMNAQVNYYLYGERGPSGWFVPPEGVLNFRSAGNLLFDDGVTETVSGNASTYFFAQTTFTIDTSLGQVTTSPLGQTMTWTAGSGPSPILSGDFHTGQTITLDRDLTTATSLSLTRYAYGLTYQFAGPGWSLVLPIGSSPPNASVTVDTPYLGPGPFQAFFEGYQDANWRVGSSGYDLFPSGSESYQPAPAPEPGTWAVMLVGFFGAGAMLRRKVRRPAPVVLTRRA